MSKIETMATDNIKGSDMDVIPPDKCGCPAGLEQPASPPTSTNPTTRVPRRAVVTLLILFYINLLNFMDRSTVSGVLPDIQKWFTASNKQAGLLITVFVCSYMIFAPIFGYLGDRYSRKYIMAVGITVWSLTTFAGSQMKESQYGGFLALRGLVGIGEASFTIVAPTIIADLFIDDSRTKALMLFNFAMPCGSGLGYICGSEVARALKNWHWALRLTPALGILGLILNLVFIQEPTRGGVECDTSNAQIEERSNTQTYVADIKKILKVRSFVWSTLGFTCVSFATGALACWAPSFILYAEQVHDHSGQRKSVSYIFGIVVLVAGVVGNLVGAEWARRWRATNMKADSYVCGIGVLFATPCLFLALWTADKCFELSWTIMFIGCVAMFFSWTPTADMLLYVIPPNCRATAEAIQILSIHVFGDAFSPLIIGAISDAYIGKKNIHDVEVKHLGLLYSFYTTLVVLCFGAGCYLVTACYLLTDKRNVDLVLANGSKNNPTSTSVSDFPPRRVSNVALVATLDTAGSYPNPGYSNEKV